MAFLRRSLAAEKGRAAGDGGDRHGPAEFALSPGVLQRDGRHRWDLTPHRELIYVYRYILY